MEPRFELGCKQRITESTFELATSFELLVRFQSKASRSTGSGEEEGLLGLSGISYLE